MKALPLIAAVVLGGGAIWLLTKGAGAGGEKSIYMLPDKYYYCTYVGPTRGLKEILIHCWSDLYTVDIYDEETDDWIQVPGPETYVLTKGTECRIKMQAPCTVYDFTLQVVV